MNAFLLIVIALQLFNCKVEAVNSSIFVNDTKCLLFYTRSIVLHNNKNVISSKDLSGDPTVKCNDTAEVSITLNILSKSKMTLDMVFDKLHSSWRFKSLKVKVTCNESNCTKIDPPVEFKVSDISSPLQTSYHCSTQNLIGLNVTNTKISFVKLQLEPFPITAKFSHPNDCIGFFSEGGLAVILVSGVLIAILSFGLVMISNIQTSDKFENPKGKQINIGGIE